MGRDPHEPDECVEPDTACDSDRKRDAVDSTARDSKHGTLRAGELNNAV
jgi:hypothetical protein